MRRISLFSNDSSLHGELLHTHKKSRPNVTYICNI